MSDEVLYLNVITGNPSQSRKLAGIRRYCAARGWEAIAVERDESTPENLPALLRRHSPVGCVVDGVGRLVDLPPRLFGRVPVVYIGYNGGPVGRHPNFHFDADAIARSAFQELSAGNPPAYAAVGFPRPWLWSTRRVAAFRRVVREAGGQCFAFRPMPFSDKEGEDAFMARLAPWLAALPEHCAVFAVSDETASLVTRAAAAARRPIPWSLTLLSVDNFTDICESASPPISSIQLDFESLGFRAARALGGAGAASDRRLATSGKAGPLLTVRRKSTSGHGRHEKFIMEAVEIIRREACDGLSAHDLAARFPVTRRLFDMRFREATGHSVLDEILHVRLEKAFTLLAQTKTAIGAIPRLCGFRCDRTLDALFRSRFHMSMRDWRKRNAR